MTSSALDSPRSSWRTVWSKTSKALGIFKPTRVLRMRSRTERYNLDSSRSWLVSLVGQAPANGLVEVERARSDDVTGAQDHDRLVATGIGDPRHFSMTGGDPTLIATLQHGMRGDQRAIFKYPNLIGERVHFDDPLPGRVGNAVKIAADAHHAFMRDPPFQLQQRAERRQRQRFEVRLLLGEGLVDDTLGGGVHARIGYGIEPMSQLAFRSSRLRNERARKKSSRM